jgi:hypothetical protein
MYLVPPPDTDHKNSHVMFYAVIRGKHLTFNVDTILVFETVIVNEGEHSNVLGAVVAVVVW